MSKPKLRPISLEELDQFQLDERNRLYWQDERVRTFIELPDWSK